VKISEFSNLWRQRSLFRLCAMVLIFLLLAGCSQMASQEGMGSDSDGAGPVNLQETPQDAISSYYEAVNFGDVELMRQLMAPGDESSQLFLSGFEEMLKKGIRMEVTDISLYVVEEIDDMVRIHANHQQKVTDDGQVVFDTESGSDFTLVRKGDKWYFIGLGDPIPPGWKIE